MIKIVGTDFRYHTDYNYNDFRDCKSSFCEEEGICRGGIIENAHIISVNIPSMVDEIYKNHFDDTLSTKRNSTINSILGGVSKEIDIYTIDRILRINKVYKPSNWEVKVCGGYYGQEIDDIILDYSVGVKIEEQIYKAFDLNDIKSRIEYLLILEYGSILPDIKDLTYSVETIERDNIIFGGDRHYRKVNTKSLEYYSDKNYNGIRGIALFKNNKFRLIDGYHRSSTSENRTIKLLVIR